MTENEVKPLFKPAAAASVAVEFVCNIGGEVSLWRMGIGSSSVIRAYTEDYRGTWLYDLKNLEAYIKKLEPYPAMQEHTDTLRRNIDVIRLYGAMLQETRSGVG